jgi:hypothetical protein
MHPSKTRVVLSFFDEQAVGAPAPESLVIEMMLTRLSS